MTPSINDLAPFDVLIARVEFEDRPGVAKPRPVIVLNVDEAEMVLLSVKVTSHAPREWREGEVVLEDWAEEGLARPSVARCSKLLYLAPSDIRARCGRLSTRDREAVLAAL